MAYPAVHKLAPVHMTGNLADLSSATATTSSCYIRAPFRARLAECGMTQFGQVTSASAVVTISIGGTTVNGTSSDGVTANVITIATGNAAGATTTYTPTSPTYVNAGDVVKFLSDHGSSTATPCTCDIVLVPA